MAETVVDEACGRVFRGTICLAAQELLSIVVDYLGGQHGSEGGFNLIFPASFGSARRIPVTEKFQQLGEAVVWPALTAFLFAEIGGTL
jgi:hypothetical protein